MHFEYYPYGSIIVGFISGAGTVIILNILKKSRNKKQHDNSNKKHCDDSKK